ncbi:11204_t:CDS:2 [Paraglomus occultum]|uniref:Vezatin n=1 Tax=Paraglomus occultum TaxID=144539 RepID=A0A9N8WRS5_9GLOM|nr:11204_t:CDS:2 [Paraglomus occultum]
MAESIVYEDTPFAEYLAEIGSEEELIQQPEVYDRDKEEKKETMNDRLWKTLAEVVSYVKEALSTALPAHEETHFEERFKYILCTSHLLNDTLSIHFYDTRRPTPTDVSDTGLYFGGTNRRNLEIMLSMAIGIVIILLTLIFGNESEQFSNGVGVLVKLPIIILVALTVSFLLYRRMRRKAMKTLHDSALYFLESLVYHCQMFDLKINRALIMIQEIELVSRGYRLSMPLSPITRIEQYSKSRRCLALREVLRRLLCEAFMAYRRAIITIKPEVNKTNLELMFEMYNIISNNESDEWSIDDDEDEDVNSLDHLKNCFHKMHYMRRELLCHFLALGIMTPGRDSHRRDYEQHWANVNEHLSELGAVTGKLVDNVITACATEPYTIPSSKQDILAKHSPLAVDKTLNAFLHKLAAMEQSMRGIQAKLYICNEDTRKYFDNEDGSSIADLISESDKEVLMNQYYSISQDITYMIGEWEAGKEALNNIIEPKIKEPVALNSIDEEETLRSDTVNGETDNEESSSQKTIIDWTQIDEPLDVPEQYFEADAEPEVKKKLTREERIIVQKAKREEEARIKAARQESENMVHELKDVLNRRKTRSLDLDPETLQLTQPQNMSIDRISLSDTRVPIAMH